MKKKAYLLVIATVLLWGSTAAVGKLLLAELGNLQVLFFLNLFASLGLFAVVLIQKKISIIKEYSKTDYMTFAWMGMLGPFLYALFFFGSLQLLSAQEAFIVNYLWPVMVVIFAAIILKEALSFRKVVGIVCSFFGVMIVISKGDLLAFRFDNLAGIALAIAGAIVYGIFSVFGKKHDNEKFTSMMFYYIFAFIYSLAALLLFSNFPSITINQLIGLVWLGVFVQGLAYDFWFLALKHGDTAGISSMVFLTPFVSLIYIHFLIGENILFSSVFGLAIIVAGILIESGRTKKLLKEA